MAETTAEKHEFQAETKALLGLMINSLYTNREVFLRELISNASDALDKARITALTDHDALGDDTELKVVLETDDAAKTLTIHDNGIGMTQDELKRNLGTIARSGTGEFMAELKKGESHDANLIGQFGVGFYSAFLVAHKVEVVSQGIGQEQAWRWISEADGTYTIEEATREGRGTDVILHLRDDQGEYLKPWRLRNLVQQYSDFVSHPIQLIEEQTEGEGDEATSTKTQETINKGQALWTRPKSELTDEQYDEFYKHLGHDWEAPLMRSHFKIEGTQLFTGLLFLPKKPGFDFWMPEKARRGLKLYVRRVFVMDDCDALLPEYLRFVRGIVDSDDLPLNVSREVLQQERTVDQIRKQVTKKALEMLEELADKDDYLEHFWPSFGTVLKEGMTTDFSNKDRIAKLLRFPSSTQDKPTSLEAYVSRMPEGQDKIYYVAGPSEAFCKKSPHIEGLKAKGYEVLFFVEAIDEMLTQALTEFDGKKLVSAAKGELDLDAKPEVEGDEAEAKPDQDPEWQRLLTAVKEILGDKVKEVRMTDRLTETPVCLVAGEHDMSANLERILRAYNRPVEQGQRTLELNRKHALVANLKRLAEDDKYRLPLTEWVHLLFDQALLTEGSTIVDPAEFAQRMTKLLVDASQRELG